MNREFLCPYMDDAAWVDVFVPDASITRRREYFLPYMSPWLDWSWAFLSGSPAAVRALLLLSLRRTPITFGQFFSHNQPYTISRSLTAGYNFSVFFSQYIFDGLYSRLGSTQLDEQEEAEERHRSYVSKEDITYYPVMELLILRTISWSRRRLTVFF